MEVSTIMELLQKDMRVTMFATVDEQGLPHNRPIHIGLANEQGIFFMTSPTTNFYAQLKANPAVALSGFSQKDYLIQNVRIEGEAHEVNKEELTAILQDNPFVDQVYPDDNIRQDMVVFHIEEGQGFYQSLTQGHRYVFDLGDEVARALEKE